MNPLTRLRFRDITRFYGRRTAFHKVYTQVLYAMHIDVHDIVRCELKNPLRDIFEFTLVPQIKGSLK